MRALLRATRRLLAVVTMLYCAGLIVLALLWTIGIQGIWWLDLANIFALCLFVPLALLAPAAFLSRGRALRGIVVIACAACLGLFGPRMIPPAVQAHSGPHIRVATFNLHYDLAESQLAAIIAAIRAQQADVVALQELSPAAAAAIQQQLVDNYPYQVLAPSIELTGMGLLSRYPLDVRQPSQGAPIQTALLRMGDEAITLINVSLTAPEIKQRRLPVVRWVKYVRNYRTSKRSREIAGLLRTIEGVRGPLLVAGDFNLSDREPEYAQLTARLHDSYRETNWGFGHTFPARVFGGMPISLPFLRIDYIWSAGSIAPAATRVECGGASDHCMVIAEMHISDGAVQPVVSR